MTTTEFETTFEETFLNGRARLSAIANELLGDLELPEDIPDVEFKVDEFDVTPESGEFTLAASTTEDWQIQLGASGLLLEDLRLSATRTEEGGAHTTSATIAGTLRIGGVTMDLSVEFPGDYRLEARIPTLNLSPVLQDLCGTAALLGFPAPPNVVNTTLRDVVITLEPTAKRCSISGQSPLGACEVVIGKDEDDRWAFLVGFVPPARWNLSALDANLKPLDDLNFESTTLVLSSSDDADLELATVELPAGTNVVRGLTMLAVIDLDGLAVDDLMHLEKVTVSSAIGTNPMTLRLEAALQGTLPLGGNVALGNMAFVLQPAPGNFALGIKGEVLARMDSSDLVFVGTMMIRPIERSASFAATMLGTWNEPYGIKGLSVADVAIDVGIGIVPPPAVVAPILGLAGSISVGSFSGSAAVKLDSANPGKSMIAASFNELHLRDVVQTFCNPEVLRQIPVEVRNTILAVGFRDVAVQVVPQPTQIGELSYEPGFRFAGKMSISDFTAEFAFALDYARGFAVRATMDSIHIGDVFVVSGSGGQPKPMLSVNLVAGSDIGVEIAGAVRLLGVEADTRISISDAGFSFLVHGKIFDVFEASLEARGGNLKSGGDFFVKAAMKNDLFSYLREKAIAEIQKGADRATRDLSAAQDAVSAAQSTVRSLQSQIDANRQTVQREREAASRDLQSAEGAVRSAQNEVNRLDGQIRSARRTIAAERERDIGRIKSARSAVTSAQSAVKSLQSHINSSKSRISTLKGDIKSKRRWYDKSPWYKKSYRWAEFSAYATAKGLEITGLYTKIGGLETARGSANLALEGAKQTLRGIERAAASFPIDADPRVAGPLAAKGGAILALEAARQALAGARGLVKVFPIDADPRVAGPIALKESAVLVLEGAKQALEGLKVAIGGMADVAQFIVDVGLGGLLDVKEAAFEGQLNAVKGGQVSLQAKVVFMKKDATVSFAFSFANPLSGAKALGSKLLESVT